MAPAKKARVRKQPIPPTAPTEKIEPSPTPAPAKQKPDVSPTPSPAAIPPALLPPATPTSHPHLLRSIDELQGLSSALSVFTHRWNELQRHLDFVQASLDSVSGEFDSALPVQNLPTPPAAAKEKRKKAAGGGKPKPSSPAVAKEERKKEAGGVNPKPSSLAAAKEEVKEERKKEAGGGNPKPSSPAVAKEEERKKEAGGGKPKPSSPAVANEEVKEERNKEAGGGNPKPSSPANSIPGDDATISKYPSSELESICKHKDSRGLRGYVIARLSDVDGLRKEITEALKLAPNPARLVLRSFNRFYLQGRKAFDRPERSIVNIRRACILLLEFFLLSGRCCPEQDDEEKPSIKEESSEVSLAWRSRVVHEGGISSASAIDALGLTLCVASYGIPPEFSSYDLYSLFRLCNLKKNASILLRSPILLEKLPDIIQDMVKKNMHIPTVDLVCTFGLEDKFPPLPLVSSFLHKTKTNGTEERREGQCSFRSLKGAYEKEISALRSVAQCLEEHGLRPPELSIPDIHQRIAKLEKEKSKCEGKLINKNSKRQVDQIVVVGPEEMREKRPRATLAETPVAKTQQFIMPAQEQGTALSDSNGLYSALLSNNSFNSGFPGLLNRNGTAQPAGNNLSSTAVGGWPAAPAGNNPSSIAVGGFPAVPARGARMPLATNSSSYDWHGEGAFHGSSVARSLTGHLGPSAENGFMVPPVPTMNSSVQMPISSFGMVSRNQGSGLYQFADTVMESELYNGNHGKGSALGNAAPGYNPAYLH